MRKNKTYKIQVTAEFANLAKLRDFFMRYGKRAGLTKKQLNDGKLAVDEAVTNVMRHAYGGGQAKGQLVMEMVRLDSCLEVRFRDWGREFDWSSVIDPDLNKYVKIRRKGGLGVWLIKKLTDRVAHERVDDMNVLSIFYNFAPEAGKAWWSQYFSVIRLRMNITLKFALLGIVLITVIISGIYMASRSSQANIASRSFLTKGINAAKNIAANGVGYLADENVLALSELINGVKNNIDTIDHIAVVNQSRKIIAVVYRDQKKTMAREGHALFSVYKRPSGVRALGKRKILYQRYSVKDGLVMIDVAVPILFGARKLGEVHLVLNRAMMEQAEGLADSQLRTFFISLLVWAVGVILVVFLASVFIHPIKKLSTAMALVGAGERNVSHIRSSVSEFSDIGRAFEDMVTRLQKSESQLTDQTRIKKEMQLAKDIQETLLPKEIPETEGFELSGNYRSALEMGGDYYDFFYVDKNALGLVVGDVSGKGIGAALIMTMVRTAMRTEARGNKRASDVLDKLNRLVANDIKKGMYITMFYVVLDSKKRTISYASAGHNPMILYRGVDQQVYFLNPRGFAVGLQLGDMDLFTKQIKSENVELANGDLLFIYTDGITEAMNAERDQFGETRLVDFIKANHHLPPHQFNDALDKEITRFTGDYPQSDDITYIVIRKKEDEDVEYYGRVSRLIELVENSNMLHEKILEKSGFTEEEYQKIFAQYKAKGLKSFEPKVRTTVDKVLSHATLEQSKKIVSIVRAHPEYGAKRIQNVLKTEEYDFEEITINVINKELKKLKLDTKRRRQHFAERELSEYTIYKDVDKGKGREKSDKS